MNLKMIKCRRRLNGAEYTEKFEHSAEDIWDFIRRRNADEILKFMFEVYDNQGKDEATQCRKFVGVLTELFSHTKTGVISFWLRCGTAVQQNRGIFSPSSGDLTPLQWARNVSCAVLWQSEKTYNSFSFHLIQIDDGFERCCFRWMGEEVNWVRKKSCL